MCTAVQSLTNLFTACILWNADPGTYDERIRKVIYGLLKLSRVVWPYLPPLCFTVSHAANLAVQRHSKSSKAPLRMKETPLNMNSMHFCTGKSTWRGRCRLRVCQKSKRCREDRSWHRMRGSISGCSASACLQRTLRPSSSSAEGRLERYA